MKYWRGYLVAGILAVCSWGLMELAKNYSTLVDMIYPYMTRMVVSGLADWSFDLDICLWQLIAVLLGLGLLASIVLMIVLRWNPIQWFGWVLAVASLLFLAHSGIYGLNYYTGSVAEDVRVELTDYTIAELEEAATYFRDEANKLALTVPRQSGELSYPDFDTLARQAGEGFRFLTYEKIQPVFAGTTLPVKKLSWSDRYSSQGITGVTVALTGESAVNPDTPAVILPYVMCREMCHRMSIAKEQDAAFAAFLVCAANSAPEFQYAAYFMAYRYCMDAMSSLTTSTGQAAANRVKAGVNAQLRWDLDTYDAFFAGSDGAATAGSAIYLQKTYLEGIEIPSVCDLLTSWYVQEYILPLQVEEEVVFDPFDESQVDLSGMVPSGR